MKITAWHIFGMLLGGGLGYFLSLPPTGLQLSRTNAACPVPPMPFSVPPTAWKSQLKAARLAPASRSETAWVKWAFAVPDEEIGNAISSLNPRADFHALRVLFSRWAQLDADAAWKAFAAIPIPEINLTFYGDSGAGLEIGAGNFQNNPRGLIMGRMLYSLHRHDPAAAMARAKKLKADNEAKRKSDSNYADYPIIQFIEEHSSPASDAEMLSDPAKQILDVLSQPASDGKQKTLRTTLEKWAGEDADGAARWLLSLPEGERRDLKLGLSADSIFRKSSPSLKSELLASGLRSTGLSQEHIATFLRIPKGQEGMHPESYNINYQLKQSAAALDQWAARDPMTAQSWLATQPDDALKPFLTGELAGTLSRTSPRDAIALLADLPDENLPVAVAGLTSGWMQKDATACAAWVAKIDDPATRDSCQQTMARSIMTSDPALALRISTQITDATVRQEIQKTITRGLSWNPAALEKTIAADPAVQASLKANHTGSREE